MKKLSIGVFAAAVADNAVWWKRASARLVGVCLWVLAPQIAMSGSAVAQSTQSSGSQLPPMMDRQKEVALALSACPKSVASKAAVYVLEKSGYVRVRESQNGFTAIVQQSLPTS